jgi:hypothetical protein
VKSLQTRAIHQIWAQILGVHRPDLVRKYLPSARYLQSLGLANTRHPQIFAIHKIWAQILEYRVPQIK